MLFIVVIDPGHGGADRTNRGPTGYIEADGVLDIAMQIKSELEKYQNVQIIMTREKDETVSLTERGMIGSVAYVFLPVHTNADPTGKARGSEVYYSVDLPKDKELAGRISAAIAREYGVPDRGAKTRESTYDHDEDYYTVIDTAQDNGAEHIFLIEALFHSNQYDEDILKDPVERAKIARIIVTTMAEYYEWKKKENHVPSPYAAQSWQKAIDKGVQDGYFPRNNVTEEQLMVFFDKMGLLE